MSASEIKRFPKLHKLVSIVLPVLKDDPTIISAIRKYAGAGIEEATIKETFDWGKGPMVEVVIMKSFGRFKLRKPDKIFIRRKMVKQFESGSELLRVTSSGRVTSVVEVTLLHELTHWAENQDEEGFSFENEVYGEVVE